MATGYTRQSTAGIVDGQTITASLFNNEFNAIVSAFHATTGHTHDGTLNGGAAISELVADTIVTVTAPATTVSGTLDVTGAVSGSGYTLTPTSWDSLSLGTNVTELSNIYPAIAADYNVPEYRKVGDMVQLRGRLGATANRAIGDVIATLPLNYRPLKNFEAVITYIDFYGTGEFPIMVKSNGDITVRVVFGSGAMLSFDNVSFSIT